MAVGVPVTNEDSSASPSGSGAEPTTYTLSISRLTIDKLGVKLYDKVSAVVGELIANSYDADAREVTVHLPLGTELATKGVVKESNLDEGYRIVVTDDGHGMTPEEARTFYLRVGRDRRDHEKQGARSRTLKRPVMGRKGIGKLAPFGICRKIEILSSGGQILAGKGFLTTHFFLDFDRIVQDTDEPVLLEVGDQDGKYRPNTGTTVTLTWFLPKRVPDQVTFLRQVATRFALANVDFLINIVNTREEPPTKHEVAQYQIETQDGTRINVKERPVPIDEEWLTVTGWLGLAKEAYKNEEMAGVRIYARGKLVATTRDFEQPAGFTGEFTMRSYLVGEVHADWLDENHGEDLIRTDRQSILWDSDRGDALRRWGAKLIKEIGAKSKEPRRKKKSDLFMAKSNLGERASERYGGDDNVVQAAIDLGRRIGAFAAEDELDDQVYVEDLAEVILSVAPHQALVNAFKEISGQTDASIADLIGLFGKARVAEMASYGQIASERVRSVQELQATVNDPAVQEGDLQRLIASAPWLIRPDWSVLTQNQSLRVFRDQFQAYWNRSHDEQINIAISHERKRPDFTLVHLGQKLHVVELKKPGHSFAGLDYERLQNYVAAFDEFFESHHDIVSDFPEGWQIDLIADSVKLSNQTQRYAFQSFEAAGKVKRQKWDDFLAAAVVAHREFLDAYEQAHAGGEGG